VLTDYREWLHGEAVAIGMVAAARVSRALGRCNEATVERLERLLKRAGLPTEIPGGLDARALAMAIQSDKKSSNGRIRFVCLEEIGRTGVVELTGQDIVSHLWRLGRRGWRGGEESRCGSWDGGWCSRWWRRRS